MYIHDALHVCTVQQDTEHEHVNMIKKFQTCYLKYMYMYMYIGQSICSVSHKILVINIDLSIFWWWYLVGFVAFLIRPITIYCTAYQFTQCIYINYVAQLYIICKFKSYMYVTFISTNHMIFNCQLRSTPMCYQ